MNEGIGASNSKTADYRELKESELFGHSFSDYFRFSFTLRMDRDEAFSLARRLEAMIEETRRTQTRVYIGVRNTQEG